MCSAFGEEVENDDTSDDQADASNRRKVEFLTVKQPSNEGDEHDAAS